MPDDEADVTSESTLYCTGYEHRVNSACRSFVVKWKSLDGEMNETTWRNGARVINIPQFTGPKMEESISEGALSSENATPLECFDAFCTPEIRDFVIRETNRYVHTLTQSSSWKDISKDEFDVWFSILIYMWVVELPCIADYWSTAQQTPNLQNCGMSRDSWRSIRSALHLTSDGYRESQNVTSERWYILHGENDPFYKIRGLLEMFRKQCASVLIPGKNLCFDELAIRSNHRSYPTLIYRKLNKHTGVGFKMWAVCVPSGYLYDFEPSVMAHSVLAPRSALLLLCKSLPHKNYRIWADNLFVSMAPLAACYELNQQIFLSGTARRDCVGFPDVIKEHSIGSKRFLNLSCGHYEALHARGPPEAVAVVWMDSEKTRFLGSGAGSNEDSLERRQRASGSSEGHGKRGRLAPKIAVDYNQYMEGVDTADHLRVIRSVERRAQKPYMPIFFGLLTRC